MSTEAPIVKSEDKSVTDQNAQAAEDAKKMLAELQGDAKPATESEHTETNGAAATTTDATSSDKPAEASEDKPQDSDRRDRRDNNGRRGDGNRGRGRGRGRGGRGGGFTDRKNNIKSDLTSQEVSDDPVAIRKQVEFYFSDSNLPMDKFLLGKVGGSENNPVEIKTIHSFKRMRHFQPFEAIVEALKESTFLELTDDNTCVKRKEPLPEALNNGPNPEAVQVFEDKAMPRSVYVKGFGEEVPSTQFDIEAFFSAYGPTNAIRLRRTDDKIFKRSVFVEFESEELAEKFLNLDPKPTYKGKDLLIMSKKQYCEQKVEDIKSGKIKGNSRGSGRGRDFKRKREGNDDRDWRDRREEDRKNGFKDNKRGGGRDNRGRDSRGRGGRGDREQKEETDERGVPVIKSTTPSAEQAKRDSAKEAALAKARAIVERDSEKTAQEAAETTEVTKKRSREDDEGDAERDVKKVDTKVES